MQVKAPRKQKTLGILDLYGYEKPDQVPGGFEQLVINFANEKLQQVMTDWTLGSEQEEYVSEAIEWTHIDYPNNRSALLFNGTRSPSGSSLPLPWGNMVKANIK